MKSKYQISLKTFSLSRMIVAIIKACEKWELWCLRVIFVLFLVSVGMNGYATEQPNLKFDAADSFYENVAVVAIGGKAGLIDINGRFVVPTNYDDIDGMSLYKGTMIVRIADKYGLISTAGKEIIPAKYEAITTCADNRPSHGLIAVKQGDKWGVDNRTGQQVVPINYDEIFIRPDGTIDVSLGQAIVMLDERGHEIIPCTCKYDFINPANAPKKNSH